MTASVARRIVAVAPVAWMAAILAVSVAPGRALPDLTGKDLAAHAVAYAVLAVLLVTALVVVQGKTRPRAATLAIIISAVYGAALEGVQHFIPGRFASLDDAAANTLGALAGAAVATAALRRRAAPAGS